jgi:hypothetical protein
MRGNVKQPELLTAWGVPFRGLAHTIDGSFWWYESDRVRYPLRPAVVRVGTPSDKDSE